MHGADRTGNFFSRLGIPRSIALSDSPFFQICLGLSKRFYGANMKKILRRLSTIGLISGFTFIISACESDEPLSESEQEAKGNLDASQAAYDETYEIVYSYVTDNYDDTETVELCDNFSNYDDDFDYDAFINDLMNEAGVQVEGDSLEDPEYSGANDATQDVLYDVCED